MNQLCGTCHRAPLGDASFNDWTDAWNVRHQPVYLEQSRCFQLSAALSCITCHRPHETLRQSDSAYYRAKCLDCHGTGRGHTISAACGTANSGNCVRCHMPLVRANDHMAFTNHWIGIYPQNSKLIPVR